MSQKYCPDSKLGARETVQVARSRSKKFPEVQRKILKAAAAVFAKAGYATSTINDLTAAAELSRGALYHYFPSKEAILCEILNDHLLGFLDVLDHALRSSTAAVEQLRAVTRAIVNTNIRSRNEQVLVLNELNQLSNTDRAHMEGLQRRILDQVSDLLIRLEGGVKITQVNKRVYTMMYLGIINYTFAWYKPGGAVKPDEYADLATELFLNGLLRDAPGARSESNPLAFEGRLADEMGRI